MDRKRAFDWYKRKHGGSGYCVNPEQQNMSIMNTILCYLSA